MFLFRKQLELTAERNTNLEKMSVFIVFIYLPYWFKTRLPLEADVSDIKFLKDLDDFKKIDDQLATKIINKFCNHLWYISKELICISFFNEDIECAEKEKMVKNLKINDDSERKLKAKVDKENIIQLTISQFVTEKSMDFFKITGISPFVPH
uniref:Uncharacterized protein n=1 Tax=Trichogramma kaykai TaxID=54128 RepID=A0ABD2XHX8_9HYME